MNKDLRNTLVWMIFATCVVGLAFWQAQVTVAKEMAARRKVLPQPAKTRHAIRPAPLTFTGDPAADYIARSEKGITDREIGWIVEDFQIAGLAEPIAENATPAQLLSYRAAQQRWYHDALVDGLRLSPEQSAQAAAKLSELFDTAKANFIEAINARPQVEQVNGNWRMNDRSEKAMQNLTTASLWLIDQESAFMPWNLCSLTPAQEKLTWKKWMEDRKKNADRPVSAEKIDSILENTLNDPLISHLLDGLTLTTPLPDGSVLVDAILPFPRPFKALPKTSPPPDESKKLPGHFQILHPAQFKLDLLFNPDYATPIQRAINGEPPLENTNNPFAE